MSELQIGLLIIGAMIIVAVLIYNKWQEVRYRRLGEKNFSSTHDDALLHSNRRPRGEDGPGGTESTVGSPPAGHFDEVPARVEPTLHAAVEPAQQRPADDPPATPAPATASAAADEFGAIGFSIRLSAVNKMDPAALAAAFATLEGTFEKACVLEVWDEFRQCWDDVRPGDGKSVAATDFRASLQLVDRKGPLRQEDLTKFAAVIEEWAASVDLSVVKPDLDESVARARKLDDFSCEVDIQIVLNLLSGQNPFAGTKIRALAEAEGFALESDGLFRRRNEDGNCLFSIANPNGAFAAEQMKGLATNALAFHFDLPTAPGGIATFDQFCQIAGRFTSALSGRLVDDNRVEISPQAMKSIRGQVIQVQNSMTEAGIPAGSRIALILFS